MITSRSLGVLLFVASLGASASAQALAGAYTVGAGGSYANMTAAISALTSNGVSGPVVFSVVSNDTGPWTIGAIPGQGAANPVLFDGGGAITLSPAGGGILTLSGCTHVTFSGFTAATIAGALVTIASPTSDCVFRNCNFSMPSTSSGATVVFSFTGGSNCTVEDCDFGGGYEAFNFSTAATGGTVQRCRILAGGFWAARIGGANFTLRNNFIYGNTNYGISCGITGSATVAVNLKIQHNSFYCTHGASTQYDTLRWYSSATSEVVNNIFYDVHPAGNATGFVMWCSGALRPTVMNYNVYYQVSGLAFVFAGANTTFAGWQGMGFDLNSVVADPQFVNIGSLPPDLHLISGSPAELVGTLIPSVVDDIDGNPRIAPVDVGAHESTANNLLVFQTTGGGVGDLVAGINNIAPNAVEGFLLISADTTHAAGTGPMLGLWPDATTWGIILDTNPASPGNPLHFALGYPTLFPQSSFVVSAGVLSFLGGTSWDVVAFLVGPGNTYAGRSNLVRANW